MQAYSHVFVGAAIAATVRPGSFIAMAVGALGGLIPDLPIGLQVFVDKLKGRKPFSTEDGTGFWFIVKEISHSPLFFLYLLLPASFQHPLVDLLFFGIYSHWVVDALTHCGPEFRNTDQSLLWPLDVFGVKPKLGQITGVWEYRYNYKDPLAKRSIFQPKMPEALICIFLLVYTGLMTVL
jgi:hypothetical protein